MKHKILGAIIFVILAMTALLYVLFSMPAEPKPQEQPKDFVFDEPLSEQKAPENQFPQPVNLDVVDDPARNIVSPWTDNVTIAGYSNDKKESLSASSTYIVDWKKQLDVDGDGVLETSQFLNWYGTNHCCFFAEIIKDGSAIFSFYNGNQNVNFEPVEGRKGFYLSWRKDEQMPAACCAIGHIETQFNWNGSKFVPVRERTIRYANKL